MGVFGENTFWSHAFLISPSVHHHIPPPNFQAVIDVLEFEMYGIVAVLRYISYVLRYVILVNNSRRKDKRNGCLISSFTVYVIQNSPDLHKLFVRFSQPKSFNIFRIFDEFT